MSMKMENRSYGNQKQILAVPFGHTAIAIKLEKQDALADSTSGRYIVKAGTIYPANDETAQGIILNDYDVTNGDASAALVVSGTILIDKLPTAPEEAAVVALHGINFIGEDVDNYYDNLKAVNDELYEAKA